MTDTVQPEPEFGAILSEDVEGGEGNCSNAATSVAELLAGSVVVVSLATTAATPPLIYEITLSHVSCGQRTGNPWTAWVLPKTHETGVPDSALPNVRLGQPWEAVSQWVTMTIGSRSVLLYDEHAADTLRGHLPDYPFRCLLTATAVVADMWPELSRAVKADSRLCPPIPRRCPPVSGQDAAMTELIARVLISAGIVPPPWDTPRLGLLSVDHEITEPATGPDGGSAA